MLKSEKTDSTEPIMVYKLSGCTYTFKVETIENKKVNEGKINPDLLCFLESLTCKNKMKIIKPMKINLLIGTLKSSCIFFMLIN